MAQNYFSNDHFKLLNKWKGQKRDKSIPEQNRAYEELKQAYDVTEAWALELQQKLFPSGRVDIRKRPTNQADNFASYNWGRIYPTQKAPKQLAYTVGIGADDGFFVKIDTVGLDESDAVRKAYLNLRGTYDSTSPIVAKLPADKGLDLNFTKLVDWSAESINNFKLTYDGLAEQLGLSVEQDESKLLKHFQGHKDFVTRQPNWGADVTALFCRLARGVHDTGLDWWFTKSTNSQLRFGRKEKGREKGRPVGWLFLMQDGVLCVAWDEIGALAEQPWVDINDEVVAAFEAVDHTEQDSWPAKLISSSKRDGYWPDEFGSDDMEVEVEPKSDVSPKNVIYYGPPGTGKTFELQGLLLNEYTDTEFGERYEFVTFHQSYGYEEFVEGLRPVIAKRDKKRAPKSDLADPSNGEIRYEIKSGAFLRLCDRARKNPSRQYAMVIDEINRGNISKIFGELITLVEVDKREGAKYSIFVTLPYSGEAFSVPSNVDVIGTMNTADRSLALVDTGLRRRFEFIESMPKPAVLAGTIVSSNGMDIDMSEMLAMLNRRIEALYDRDHTIGHAYFTQLKELPVSDRFAALKAIFKNRIIPLLEEYFFEDWQKIRLVLGDNQKSKKDHQFVHEISHEEDLLAIFGREHELDQYAIRSRYQLNAQALDQPEAYVGIYAANAAVADVVG